MNLINFFLKRNQFTYGKEYANWNLSGVIFFSKYVSITASITIQNTTFFVCFFKSSK